MTLAQALAEILPEMEENVDVLQQDNSNIGDMLSCVGGLYRRQYNPSNYSPGNRYAAKYVYTNHDAN